MSLPVGFIGLGEMGAPIAAHILRAGFSLHIHNRTASRMQPLCAQGASACDTSREMAARADVVLLCLFDANATEAMLFGDGGLLHSARPDQLIVDLSTSPPARARDFATRLQAQGIGWVDAPISGGPQGAQAGTLAVMAGGDAANVERARPILASFASQVTHVGPAGCGQVAKACNQMINFGNAALIVEAMHLAARQGLDPRILPTALAGGFADSGLLRHIGPKMATGTMSGNTLMTMKDMEIALELGRDSGTALPVTELIGTFFRVLIAEGRICDGIGRIARYHVADSFAQAYERPLKARDVCDLNRTGAIWAPCQSTKRSIVRISIEAGSD